MPELIAQVWLIGWVAIAVAITAGVLVKLRRGTFTQDDVFDTWFRLMVALAWPLLIVSGIVAVITLAAVTSWEARADD